MKIELDKKMIEAIEELKKEIQRLQDIDDPCQCFIEENKAIDKFLEKVYKKVEPQDTVKKLWDKVKETISKNAPSIILKLGLIDSIMSKLEPLHDQMIKIKNLIKKQSDKNTEGSLRQLFQQLINKHEGK